MEETSTLKISAFEAREITEKARANNYQKVMERIDSFAKMGLNECPLVGIGLGISDVEKLMKAGFSVSTFLNPIDLVTFYRVSW